MAIGNKVLKAVCIATINLMLFAGSTNMAFAGVGAEAGAKTEADAETENEGGDEPVPEIMLSPEAVYPNPDAAVPISPDDLIYPNHKDNLAFKDAPVTKLSDLVDGLSAYYIGEPNRDYIQDVESAIVIKSGEKEKLIADYVFSPTVSPDKRRIAYVSPNGWEIKGEVYIHDARVGSTYRVVTMADYSQYTPKIVEWLDNRYLLVIIGGAYGTVTRGGNVYLYDTQANKLPLLIKAPEGQEITEIKIRGRDLVLDLFDAYTYMNSGEVVLGQKTLGLETVMQAFAAGKTVNL